MAKMHLSPQHFALAFFTWTFSLILALPVPGQQSDKPASPASAPAKEAPEDDKAPNPWSVRSYRVPEGILADFKAPPMPEEDAGAEVIRSYILDSTELMAPFFQKHGISLPKGSLVVADSEHARMAVRTTRGGHEYIASLNEMFIELTPYLGSFSVDVFEVATADALKLLDRALASSDHASLLSQVESKTELGEAKALASGRVDSKPTTEVKIIRATTRPFGEEFEFLASGSGTVSKSSSRRTGLVFQIQSAYSPVLNRFDLSYQLEFHLADPSIRQIPIGSLNRKRISVPGTDFHVARAEASISLLGGQSRLLGAWKALGDHSERRQVIAFLTADVAPLLPPDSSKVFNLLKDHVEDAIETPLVELHGVERNGALEDEREPRMVLRRFRGLWKFRPELLDPLIAPAPHAPDFPDLEKLSAMQILEQNGIPFPQGATAEFLPEAGELLVRNLPENLDLIGELLGGCFHTDDPIQLQFLLHIVEAVGPTLRKLNRKTTGSADHTPIWSELQKEIDGNRARIVHSAWTSSVPGVRITNSAGTEYAFNSQSWIEEGRASNELESRLVGLQFEVLHDYNTNPNLTNLELALNFDTAPPTERFAPPENKSGELQIDFPSVNFHRAELHSQLILQDGKKHLVGTWKPKGTPEIEAKDLLQAAFVEVRKVKLSDSVKNGVRK